MTLAFTLNNKTLRDRNIIMKNRSTWKVGWKVAIQFCQILIVQEVEIYYKPHLFKHRNVHSGGCASKGEKLNLE